MRAFSVTSALLLALAACSSPTGVRDERGLLEHHRAVWLAAGIANYRYSLERVCECIPESSGPVVIEVRNGEIEDRRYATGAPVDPQFSELFTTIDGLFDVIESALDLPAAGIAVRYHRRLGYPESIQIDWVAGTTDDEVSYKITGFASLAPE